MPYAKRKAFTLKSIYSGIPTYKVHTYALIALHKIRVTIATMSEPTMNIPQGNLLKPIFRTQKGEQRKIRKTFMTKDNIGKWQPQKSAKASPAQESD